jgi:hypothetical protein
MAESSRDAQRQEASEIQQPVPSLFSDAPPIKLSEIAVGEIAWLPRLEYVKQRVQCVQPSSTCLDAGFMKDGAYRHPILILRIFPLSSSPEMVIVQFSLVRI